MAKRSDNKNLIRAKDAKDDEFFTRYSDVADEVEFYAEHFKDKIVYCNADNPYLSNFYKYFKNNFANLQLKKLIATNYSLTDAYKAEFDGNEETITKLNGNGDFRSEECLALLKEADIIVTNPPFSLFREFITTLDNYNKKFLIVVAFIAITYNVVFPLLMNRKMWLGYNAPRSFLLPDGQTVHPKQVATKWYTNIGVRPYIPTIKLTKKYSPERYPKFDGQKAINVDSYRNIPFDYYGVMGVPITFIEHWNDKQFDLVGVANSGITGSFQPKLNGEYLYARILVRRIQYLPPDYKKFNSSSGESNGK